MTDQNDNDAGAVRAYGRTRIDPAPMDPSELDAHLAALSLTDGDAARLLGVSRRTMLYWRSARYLVPRSVALAVRLMAKHGEVAADWMPPAAIQDVQAPEQEPAEAA